MFKTGYSRLYSKSVYSACDVIVANILNPEGDLRHEYILDLVSVKTLIKPNKWTALHEYINSGLDFYSEYWTRKTDDLEEWAEYIREMGVDAPSFLVIKKEWTRSNDQIRLTDDLLREANLRLTPSVFYILFQDREICRVFHTIIAKHIIKMLNKDEYPDSLKCNGNLKRPTYIPTWLKRAIWYRDKGRCQLCWTDLSGSMEPIANAHLDHMIPLARYGSNDPTNFQLVCGDCNAFKGSSLQKTMPRIPLPWPN